MGKNGKYICDDCYKVNNNKYIFKKAYNKYFDYMICDSYYIGKTKKLIHNFKFYESSYLYKYFIELVFKKENICNFLKNFDFITYIPMNYKRELKRGYNQSELLAKELGKRLDITVIKSLRKNEKTKIQSTLTENEREENMKDAFSFLENIEIENKNIILVDDILTTGATVNSASKVLKENGASKICVFTISKTKFKR